MPFAYQSFKSKNAVLIHSKPSFSQEERKWVILFLYHRCHEFYNLSSNLRKRSTGFGYGKKYDFTKEYDIDNERLPDTPAPGVYEK